MIINHPILLYMYCMQNILVFTIEEDSTSTIVCDIIKNHFHANPIRINGGKGLDFISFNLDGGDFLFKVYQKCYSLDEIHSVWFRKNVTGFNISYEEDNSIKKLKRLYGENDLYEQNLRSNVMANRRDLFNLFLRMLTIHTKTLGDPFIMGLNKLRVLRIARSIGINVPKSWVLTKKVDVEKIMSGVSAGLITKPIEEGFYYFSEDYAYNVLTSRIDNRFIESLPKTFPPSLFQEEIKKEFEIRSFYLDGEFFSMAIFSQDDKQTEVDYRNYNRYHPNRVNSYNLPIKIQRQLKNLFEKIGLNCGSVDLIKTVDGDFVFLEINPVGQFGMVSIPCNYNLEYLVAKWLVE